MISSKLNASRGYFSAGFTKAPFGLVYRVFQLMAYNPDFI